MIFYNSLFHLSNVNYTTACTPIAFLNQIRTGGMIKFLAMSISSGITRTCDQEEDQDGGKNVMEPGAVFHINEASVDKQRKVLKNIENLHKEMPDILVELVVQGDAINLVVDGETALKSEIAQLQQQGVVMAVCQNTMRGKGINREELASVVTIVPSAVGELVRRQQKGMAYIKP
jgi:hypothetical protein